MKAPEGWLLEDGALTREYAFANFAEAFGVLTQVALHAERVNHHPEFTSVWNRIYFRLTSHDEGRPTKRDLNLAVVIDRLASKALESSDEN